MKRYDNGELVTKDRMQDEDWYYDYYQPFLEFVIGFTYMKKRGESSVGEMYEKSIEFLEETFGEKLSDEIKEKFLRWSVLQTERFETMPEYEERSTL